MSIKVISLALQSKCFVSKQNKSGKPDFFPKGVLKRLWLHQTQSNCVTRTKPQIVTWLVNSMTVSFRILILKRQSTVPPTSEVITNTKFNCHVYAKKIYIQTRSVNIQERFVGSQGLSNCPQAPCYVTLLNLLSLSSVKLLPVMTIKHKSTCTDKQENSNKFLNFRPYLKPLLQNLCPELSDQGKLHMFS